MIYTALHRTSIAAGIFSLAVCILLAVNFIKGKVENFVDSTELTALKEKFKNDAIDKELKNTIQNDIRAFDLQLRKDYFRRRHHSLQGAYLLLGGVVLFLICFKTADIYRKKPHMPPEKNPEPSSKTATKALWTVGAFAIVFGTLVFSLSLCGNAGLNSTQTPKIPPYPSDEEIKKNWPCFRGPGGSGISA